MAGATVALRRFAALAWRPCKRTATQLILSDYSGEFCFGSGWPILRANRWRGQLGLTTLSDDDARKELKPLKVDGRDAHAFDATGPDEPDKEAQRIRIVIVPVGEQLWFFRLSGPASLVKREGKAFDEFIGSVRFAK